MLEKGGFNALKKHDLWTVSPERYAADVHRYNQEIGNLPWAASQDWMCEPPVIYGGTHKGQVFAGTRQFIDPYGRMEFDQLVQVHQERTVENFVELQQIWLDHYANTLGLAASPFVPTVQGWTPKQYLRCWDIYRHHGINLADYGWVCVGSVCTRESTDQIQAIIRSLRQRDPEILWHLFGVKQAGLELVGFDVYSVDSQAWSFGARYENRKLPTCTAKHRNCAYCLPYALDWHQQLVTRLSTLDDQQRRRRFEPVQLGLFEAGAA